MFQRTSLTTTGSITFLNNIWRQIDQFRLWRWAALTPSAAYCSSTLTLYFIDVFFLFFTLVILAQIEYIFLRRQPLLLACWGVFIRAWAVMARVSSFRSYLCSDTKGWVREQVFYLKRKARKSDDDNGLFLCRQADGVAVSRLEAAVVWEKIDDLHIISFIIFLPVTSTCNALQLHFQLC